MVTIAALLACARSGVMGVSRILLKLVRAQLKPAGYAKGSSQLDAAARIIGAGPVNEEGAG